MPKLSGLFALIGACALAPSLLATPAHAANAISFVSVNGADSHGCSNSTTDACRTIAVAVGKTADGGQIVCVDSGDFSAAVGGTPLSGVLTIDCSGTTAIMNPLDIEGANSTITVRNLTFRQALGAPVGIQIQTGANVVVENCVFVGFTTSGIRYLGSTAGSKLSVTDSLFVKNGSGSTGAGILITPLSGGSVLVNLNRVNVQDNVFGIAVDGTGSTGGINMTIRDSVTSGNSQDGILATTPPGGAPIGVMVENTASTNNNIGIRSIGPNVTIRVSNATVTGNGVGLVASSGGALLTFGNNKVRANGSDGAFTGSVGLQ